MAYLLDANVYIEASKGYYAHDTWPAFWIALESLAESGDVFSIDGIFDEITRADNALAEWAETNRSTPMFRPESDPSIQHLMTEVADWVLQQSYGQEHVAKFLAGADPWLVAAAKHWNLTLVTQEKPVNDPATKKVKIPNVCIKFDVDYCDTFEMLKRLGVIFS